jgi:hypothetical protein
MRPLRAYFAILAAVVLSGCAVDIISHDRRLDCRFNGTSMAISSTETNSTVELKPYTGAAGDYEFEALFSNRREDAIYLVLKVSGRSPTDAAGACTNGMEKNLIWLKLDLKLHLKDAKSVLVGSCAANITSVEDYRITGNRLAMIYVRSSFDADGGQLKTKRMQSVLHYDNEHPEAGFAIETQEVKLEVVVGAKPGSTQVIGAAPDGAGK